MSHDTHHHAAPVDNRPGSSFTSSIWFVLLLAGLFIAAINFVDVMSHSDGGHDAHGTEHTAPAHDAHAGGDDHGHGH